jgi:hypothetical protein
MPASSALVNFSIVKKSAHTAHKVTSSTVVVLLYYSVTPTLLRVTVLQSTLAS